ncbi:MAG: TetR family transcriptional regulator [Alphaproteobacteria bacterium]|nr:TetR family transcriptional regulator [Alphaproteobacteria bacterium]
MSAAKYEFAKNGLGGARVDVIAARAKSNKRMMYHYFGDKERLFTLVIEDAYADFREAEKALELDHEEPITALRKLVAFNWDYFLKNPEFITLVNSENLHRAKHIKNSKRMLEMSRNFVGRMKNLLERGAKLGLFHANMDATQVQISVAALAYHYLTNRHTGTIVFERDLMSPQALKERLEFNTLTVLRMVCTPQTLQKLEQGT